MRTFWALLQLELQSGKIILLAALVAGFLPLLAPWMPGADQHPAVDVQVAVLIVTVPLFAGLLILGLGSSLLARALAEQRLSFFFTRPISGASLWFAKLAGNYLLILVAVSLVSLPSLVLVSVRSELFESRLESWTPIFVLSVLAVCTLFLLALVHVLTVMIRARTAWLFFDLLAVALLVGLAWRTHDHLISNQVQFLNWWLPGSLLVLGLATLLFVGCVQTSVGRNDLERSHQILSLTFWPLLLVILLGFFSYTLWLTSPSQIEISRMLFFKAAPQGPWVAVGGQLRYRSAYDGLFLLNTQTGHSHHVGGLEVGQRSLVFSENGEFVVHARCHRLWRSPCDLEFIDLTQASPLGQSLQLEVASPMTPLALSADGTRLAIWSRDQLAAYELPSARLIAAVRTERPIDFHFHGGHEIWLLHTHLQGASRRSEVTRFDLRTRKQSHEELPAELFPTYLTAPTGIPFENLREIPLSVQYSQQNQNMISVPYPPIFQDSTRYLADGRLLWLRRWNRVPHLSVLSAEGQVELEIELPHTPWGAGVVLGGEVEPGKVIVAVHGFDLRQEPFALAINEFDEGLQWSWTSFLVDLNLGEWKLFADGVKPVRFPRRQVDGSEAARLFLSRSALLKSRVEDPRDFETLLAFVQESPPFELFF